MSTLSFVYPFFFKGGLKLDNIVKGIKKLKINNSKAK